MSSAYDKLSADFQDVAEPTEVMLEQLERIARHIGRRAWIQRHRKTVAFTNLADFYIDPNHESMNSEDVIELDPRDTYETIFASYNATRIPPEEVGGKFTTAYTITAIYEEPLESIKQVADTYQSQVIDAVNTVYENDEDIEEYSEEDGSLLEASSTTDATEDAEPSDDTSTVDTDDDFEPIIRLKHRHTYNIQANPFVFAYEQSFDYDIGRGAEVNGPYFNSEQMPVMREIHNNATNSTSIDTILIDQRDPEHESLHEEAIFNDEELLAIIHSNLGELSTAGNSDDEHARRVLGLLAILAPDVVR